MADNQSKENAQSRQNSNEEESLNSSPNDPTSQSGTATSREPVQPRKKDSQDTLAVLLEFLAVMVERLQKEVRAIRADVMKELEARNVPERWAAFRDEWSRFVDRSAKEANKTWGEMKERLEGQEIIKAATADRSQATSPPPNGINVNKLGFFHDGWSDLVEGMGAKAEQVRKNVMTQLEGRGMPDIQLGNRTAYVSLVSRDRRDYVISKTHPGATTTVYIAQHGSDLYASWRTFIRPTWNMMNLIAIVLVSAVLGLLTGGIQETRALLGPATTSFCLLGWVLATLGFLVFLVFLMATAGRLFKGDNLAYFFIEPSWFDAEDITAMGLSVHKSILRSLDASGIEVSKLRLKQTFKGGRRDVEV